MHTTLASALLLLASFSFAQEPASTAKEETFRKNQDMITKMVELRLTVPKTRSRSVNARLEFVGHPELNPFKSTRGPVERMCLYPGVNGQEGFTIELRDAKGELVPLAVKDRHVRIAIPGIKPGQNHVYRTINQGVFETLTLPLSSWFALTKPGTYSVRVQYTIHEASTIWMGPATSNVASFGVN